MTSRYEDSALEELLESVRGIVLDIDDTLYLERDYVLSGFKSVEAYVSQTYGIHGFARVSWKLFEAGRRGDIFDIALAELGVSVTPTLVDGLVHHYRNHRPTIALLPDSLRLLNTARSAVRLGIISDGPKHAQQQKVVALGLDRHGARIVLTDELGPEFWKPNLRPFQDMEQFLGLAGSRLVYVADNPAKDFVGPHALGWRTIRVARDGGLHAERTEPQLAPAEITLPSLEPMVRAIAKRVA